METRKAFIRKKSTRLMQKLADNGYNWSRHDESYEHCLMAINNCGNNPYFPCTVKEAKSDGAVDFKKDEKAFFDYITDSTNK